MASKCCRGYGGRSPSSSNLSRESGREPALRHLTRGSMARSAEGEGDRDGFTKKNFCCRGVCQDPATARKLCDACQSFLQLCETISLVRRQWPRLALR